VRKEGVTLHIVPLLSRFIEELLVLAVDVVVRENIVQYPGDADGLLLLAAEDLLVAEELITCLCAWRALA
jgi:hypothetical protein